MLATNCVCKLSSVPHWNGSGEEMEKRTRNGTPSMISTPNYHRTKMQPNQWASWMNQTFVIYVDECLHFSQINFRNNFDELFVSYFTFQTKFSNKLSNYSLYFMQSVHWMFSMEFFGKPFPYKLEPQTSSDTNQMVIATVCARTMNVCSGIRWERSIGINYEFIQSPQDLNCTIWEIFIFSPGKDEIYVRSVNPYKLNGCFRSDGRYFDWNVQLIGMCSIRTLRHFRSE